ncbi:hypothetical protein BX600DRAFT_258143 [Xylariales sp. PMI_506]|nr:hypothetical protein BX600DRAFT_258143 [Xylariales sp. PMI_506]
MERSESEVNGDFKFDSGFLSCPTPSTTLVVQPGQPHNLSLFYHETQQEEAESHGGSWPDIRYDGYRYTGSGLSMPALDTTSDYQNGGIHMPIMPVDTMPVDPYVEHNDSGFWTMSSDSNPWSRDTSGIFSDMRSVHTQTALGCDMLPSPTSIPDSTVATSPMTSTTPVFNENLSSTLTDGFFIKEPSAEIMAPQTDTMEQACESSDAQGRPWKRRIGRPPGPRRSKPIRAKLYACGIEGCGKTFTLEKDLARHQLYSSAHQEYRQESWICSEERCNSYGRSFSRGDNYERHVRTMHNLDKSLPGE